MKENKICATCVWVRYFDIEPPLWECHYNPPGNKFPEVRPTDFCREWQKAEGIEEEELEK